MDIRNLFGANFRRFRLQAGLSQEAVAIRMDVDRAHVSAMERGQQNVTLLTIWHASQALSVTPAALLEPFPTGAGATTETSGDPDL
ncbi:helix-turn-helix domain-containing protein [Acidiphilium sp. MT5]